MLPSCGWNQLSLRRGDRSEVQAIDVLGIEQRAPERRIVGEAGGDQRRPDRRRASAACGHSTTVAKGNMYSFFAIAASGDAQKTTVGSR